VRWAARKAPQAGNLLTESKPEVVPKTYNLRFPGLGQPSVFDMIRVLGGQKNPHDAWARLVETHPEVLGKCENLQFPGPGQRETPVAKTKEDAYYILGLR
jgi:hypothetical protein